MPNHKSESKVAGQMAQALAGTFREIQGGEVMCEYCDETKEKYMSLRRDDIYGKEFIAVRKLGPCKMDPDRNKWITSAYVNGGNLYAVINYCPMCGRKLTEDK